MPRTGQPPQLSWIFQVVWAWSTRVWSRRMSLLAETLHPFQTAAKIRTAVEGRGQTSTIFNQLHVYLQMLVITPMLIWHFYTVLVRKTGNPKPLRSRLWTQAVLMFNSLEYTFIKLYDSSPIGSMCVIFTYIDHKSQPNMVMIPMSWFIIWLSMESARHPTQTRFSGSHASH